MRIATPGGTLSLILSTSPKARIPHGAATIIFQYPSFCHIAQVGTPSGSLSGSNVSKTKHKWFRKTSCIPCGEVIIIKTVWP